METSDPRTVTPATVQVPLIALGKWMVMAVGVGILIAIAAAKLRHTDGGDQDHDAGRLAQSADDGQVDDGPEGQSQHQGDGEANPERHVILDDEQRQDGGADDAHVADGEVDDPGGAIDQHHTYRDDGDRRAPGPRRRK